MTLDLTLTHKQIDIHLRRLPRHCTPSKHDEEDLRQEILCEMILLHGFHDPTLASRETYHDGIVKKHLEKHLSRQRSMKHRPHESVHDIDEQREPLTNDVRACELDVHQRRVFVSELQDAIDRLPDDLRKCCELLKRFSPSETATILNASPATVFRKIQSIQSHLTEAGFHPDE